MARGEQSMGEAKGRERGRDGGEREAREADLRSHTAREPLQGGGTRPHAPPPFPRLFSSLQGSVVCGGGVWKLGGSHDSLSWDAAC